MNTMNDREYGRYIRNAAMSAWLAYRAAEQIWYAEIHVRTPRGVVYVEAEYPKHEPSLRQMIASAFQCGHFSIRPCEIYYPFDPSMAHAAIAYLQHWCTHHGVSVRALIDEAYASEPERAHEDLEAIREQAEWEGIIYPKAEDSMSTRWLIAGLHALGYRSLSAVCHRAARALPRTTL